MADWWFLQTHHSRTIYAGSNITAISGLMMLVYDDPEHEGDLMHYELPDVAHEAVEASPSIMIIDHGPGRKLYGYDVPLVHVGDPIAA
jgi:hypothetical protein